MRVAPLFVILVLACGGDDPAPEATDAPGESSSGGQSSSTGGSSPGDVSTTTSGEGRTSDATTGQGTTDETSEGGDGGPSEYCGAVLFAEGFEDADFEARGWYDGPSGTLSSAEGVPGSSSSLECRLAPGAQLCEGGTPSRHLFDGQAAFCLRYFVKYSEGYIGSGLPYHPHEFLVVTNADDIYVGPANTRLTTYVEHAGGTPRIALQDSLNVDQNCVLLNDDSIVGCDGDFDTYPFTEERSAAACNGLIGVLEGRDCYANAFGYYSARFWDADVRAFGDAAPYDQTEWHEIHAYFRLNDIVDGAGVPNGVIMYWFDGEPLIALDEVLMRTGSYPDMRFNQLLIAPYIGDGSPVDQTMWIDELEVRAGL